MKEIAEIISAYHQAKQAQIKVALATVVHVEGSSYRKPGARMLVTEKGHITGAISGGCLEGDALRKALNVMISRQNKIVSYDTTDEDVTFGVQLGCQGIVHILFEPIDYLDADNPVALLQQVRLLDRKAGVMCTLFSLNKTDVQTGSALLYSEEILQGNCRHDEQLTQALVADAKKALRDEVSAIRQYVINNTVYSCLMEILLPPIRIVIAGAGNDAQPVVVAAKNLGWEVVLLDGRATHATSARFPQADKIMVGSPADLMPAIQTDQRTALVLMTHNYNYDKEMLGLLLPKYPKYIGCLGPKKKLNRMVEELAIEAAQCEMIHGPVGLDIGADTPEEVAISIVAEIKAVMSNRTGEPLKWKNSAIHERYNGDYLVPAYFVTGKGNYC